MSNKTKKRLLFAALTGILALSAVFLVGKPLFDAEREKQQQVKEDAQWKEFFAWRDS